MASTASGSCAGPSVPAPGATGGCHRAALDNAIDAQVEHALLLAAIAAAMATAASTTLQAIVGSSRDKAWRRVGLSISGPAIYRLGRRRPARRVERAAAVFRESRPAARRERYEGAYQRERAGRRRLVSPLSSVSASGSWACQALCRVFARSTDSCARLIVFP